MENLYYGQNSLSFLTGQKQLARQAKEELASSRKQVNKFLQSQDVWQLHKPVRRIFPRLSMIASNVDKQWQADLVEMIPFAETNDEYKYILTVIDTVSRFAFTRALEDKTSKTVAAAFEDIFRKSKRVCEELYTDEGREFMGSDMKNLLRKRNVLHIKSASRNKAALCERFNRTLKSVMYRFFTYAKTDRWIDILQILTDSYNQRVHRMIGLAPAKVNLRTQALVFKQPAFQEKIPQPKFTPNQKVRISYAKLPFTKGYAQSFTSEIFKIIRIIPGTVITYKLEDVDGNPIRGRFYENDLVLVP